MKKEQIRLRIKAHKALLTNVERISAAKRVWNALEETVAFLMADKVLLYNALPDELETRQFIDKWSRKKRLFLPRVNGLNLDILPYDGRPVEKGAYNIFEPTGFDCEPVDNIDLIIVPAVAYDRCGNRVGRGKGFYDRLLAKSRAAKIGVGYDFQLIDEIIDAEPHDIRVDMVITERRTMRINNTTNKTS
ncbi:MAG: 5-formyltetrahydrofolate cyclo-ligase [Muribaculum sp.]|nr:5-formyltetrahydrofolate cyclo-ligase [Muribaculaceae bacterium]MCM1080358.1 5-formyltetrahydrofolate cyclo-ligase [Muribaculum sp.]